MMRKIPLFSLLAIAALTVSASDVADAKKSKAGCPANSSKQQCAKKVTTNSGLQYEDKVVGKGASPQPGQIVVVHYTGWLTNGTKFDSSVDRGEPFKFPIGQGRVIKGWDEGVATMKIGGKRRLTIPGDLAYGPAGAAGGKIPPNATLVFDVELLGLE